MRSLSFSPAGAGAGAVAGAVLLRTGMAQDNSIEPRPARALNHIGIVDDDYDAASRSPIPA
jgi:hypothetical protein